MKIKIVSVFIIFSFAFTEVVRAQESELGIRGGLNFSNMSVAGSNDDNLKTGIMFGVFNTIPIAQSFSVQPEVIYSSKGLNINYDGGYLMGGESKFKLHYIEVPVKGIYNLSEDFEFQFGPYISYLVDARFETDADLGGMGLSSEDDIDRDNFKSLEFGLTGGLGFDFNPFVFGFNYNVGLSKVAKDDEPAGGMLGDAKNNVIQIYAGYTF